ncbi:MAG: hypothetical protein LWW85_15095 [Marinilabiliales bacterium]|nr:hypothetical protein [Marinilabiliales bacterium]
METHELYLPMLVPLWAIFIGLALVVVGFVDKKPRFTYGGWMILCLSGLYSLYANLFLLPSVSVVPGSPLMETASQLQVTGWLNVAGAFLALASLLFLYFKKRRYLLLAVLTLAFFILQFFEYYHLLQKPK